MSSTSSTTAGSTNGNQGGNQRSTVGTQGSDSSNERQNTTQVSPDRMQRPFVPQIPRVLRGSGLRQDNSSGQNGVRANVFDQDETRANVQGQNGARAHVLDQNEARANVMNNEARANVVDQNEAGRNVNNNGGRANVLNQNEARANVQDEERNRARRNEENQNEVRANVLNQNEVRGNVLNQNQERHDRRNIVDVDGDVDAGRPRNRQRTHEYEAYDQHVAACPLFAGRHNPIRLQDLQRDDALQHNLDFKYLDLQILRIIIPSNKDTATYYHGRRNNNQTTLRFTRLFLMRVVTENMREDHMKVAYVMEAKNMNQNLFQNALQYRDNGAITVGSIIRYPSPHPITTYMRNDIPMLNSNTSSVVLKIPRAFYPIPMRRIIEADNTSAFVVNGTRLNVYTTTPIATSCRGKLCDKQRVSDWNMNRNKGCGCYGMHANASAMAFMHAIMASNDRTEETYHMNDFSSTRFTGLYTTGQVPPSASCTVLDKAHHQQGIQLIDCMNNCVNYINSHGGFTIIGWYKRGLIDDKSLITLNNADNRQVQSGDISHHIVSIMPTNRDFLQRRSPLFIALTARKFNVNDMEGA